MEVPHGSLAMLDRILGNEALVKVTHSLVMNDAGSSKEGHTLPSPSFCPAKLPTPQPTAVPQSGSAPELSLKSKSPENLQCLLTVSESLQCGTPLDGALALRQLQKSVEATSLHVDLVMDRGKKILCGGKGSRAGGSSKKRSRSIQAYDSGANDSKIEPAMKIECPSARHRAINGEKVEKMPNRKSRCQGSKRSEKKACQQSLSTLSDQVYSKGRSTNSLARAGTFAILDIYGLKAKHIDLSRHMIEVSLDQLLLGTPRSAEVSERDVGGSEGNLGKLIINVLNCFSNPHAGCSSVYKLNLEGHFSKPIRELEPSGRPEEKFPAEAPERKTSKETCAKNLSVLPVLGSEINACCDTEDNLSIPDLSPKFSLDKLPNYPLEDFLSRLKRSPSALNIAISDSKLEGAVEVVDLFGTPISSSINDYSMPPLPYSPPIVGPVKTHIENDRSGKSGKVYERRWFRGGTNEFDAMGDQILTKKAAEDPMKMMAFSSAVDSMIWKNLDGRLGKNLRIVSGDQAVLIGSVRVTLDAQGGMQNSTNTAPIMKSGLSGRSQADLNLGCIVERPIISNAEEEDDSSKLGREQSVLQAGLSNMHGCSFVEIKEKNFAELLPVSLTSKPFSAEEPVALYSPRAQDAAWTLCSMANSMLPLNLEKRQVDRGKRQRFFQPHLSGSRQKASKIPRTNGSMDRSPVTQHAKSDEIGVNIPADGSITSEKLPTCEKRKSGSHINQIIAATDRLSGSFSCRPVGGTSSRPRDYVLLSAVQSGSPTTNLEMERQRCPRDPEREANYVDCTVASKMLSKALYQPVKPSKESFTLKVKTFTGGPPKQKRVMTTNFPKVSLNSSGSKLLPESSRSSQKLVPSSLNSVLGSKTDNSLIVPVKSWSKNHVMEKQDARQRQDSRLARPSRE